MKTKITCAECGRSYGGDMVNDRFGGVCPRCLAAFAIDDPGPGTPTEVQEPAPLKKGATIRQYEIQELIGRGGMGYVYKAHDSRLNRIVAIKVLAPRLASDPEFERRFNREAQVQARLVHPNIVGTFEVANEGDLLILVMEYVEGVSLRELMNDKSIGSAEALKIVPQICKALEYAHSQNVVHRDIKPENILIDRTGQIKIVDFGLGKIMEALPAVTLTNMVMGTPQYMAPEQKENMRDVDHRADIYSLGVVLYEMLTGEVPMGFFDPPSEHGADDRMDAIVRRALERRPERRYQEARQFGTDVENVRHRAREPVAMATRWPVGVFVAAAVVFIASFIPWGYLKANTVGFQGTIEATAWNGWLNLGGLQIPNWLVFFAAAGIALICGMRVRGGPRLQGLTLLLSFYAVGHTTFWLLMVGSGGTIGFGSVLTLVALIPMAILATQGHRRREAPREVSQKAVTSLILIFVALIIGVIVSAMPIGVPMFSVFIVFGVIFLLSLVSAIQGLVEIRQSGGRIGGTGYAVTTFVLWGLMFILAFFFTLGSSDPEPEFSDSPRPMSTTETTVRDASPTVSRHQVIYGSNNAFLVHGEGRGRTTFLLVSRHPGMRLNARGQTPVIHIGPDRIVIDLGDDKRSTFYFDNTWFVVVTEDGRILSGDLPVGYNGFQTLMRRLDQSPEPVVELRDYIGRNPQLDWPKLVVDGLKR